MLGWQVGYFQAKKLEGSKNWPGAIRNLQWLADHGEGSNARVLYRLGHNHFMAGDLDRAALYVGRAVTLEPENSAWRYRYAFILERAKNFEAARIEYDRVIELDPENSEYYYRRSRVHAALKNPTAARSDLSKAVGLKPSEAKYHAAVAKAYRGTVPLWQEVQALEDGLSTKASDPLWHLRMGEIYSDMGQFESAANAFHNAVQLTPKAALWHYREGRAWESAGRPDKAAQPYAIAIELDTKLAAQSLGIGVYHEQAREWRRAAQAYQQQAHLHPSNSLLWFRMASMLEKCYDWPSAATAFRRCAVLEPTNPQAHYGLGFALERQELWAEAAGAYYAGSRVDGTNDDYWTYRLGFVLDQSGDQDAALSAFEAFTTGHLNLQDKPSEKLSSSDDYFTGLGRQAQELAGELNMGQLYSASAMFAEAKEDWAAATDYLRQAIDKSDDHDPDLHLRLGRALKLSGKTAHAAKAVLASSVVQKAIGGSARDLLAKPVARRLAEYSEQYDALALDEELVLLESNHGASIGCNPLAIYNAMIQDPRLNRFRFIWVLNDIDKAPKDLRSNPRVSFTSRGSDLYHRYLASAKYLINNNTFPPHFMLKQGQKYLNTWHGTPIKTLGKDIGGGFMEHRNATRNFLHATHLLMPNEYTRNVILDRYDVEGITTARVATTGYPRIDSTLNVSPERREELRSLLGAKPGQPIVLYAPTWRGSLGEKKFETDKLISDLTRLQSDEYRLLFRGHQNSEALLTGTDLASFLVPQTLESNELLGVVDVLITDYSSIFFDFYATGRPVIYYAYDLDEYSAERGLYLSLADLPGQLTETVEQLAAAIPHALAQSGTVAAEYIAARREYCPQDDGNASVRAIEFFIFDDESCGTNAHDSRQSILFYQGSFIPNGIMIAFLNLVNRLPKEKFKISVIVDPEELHSRDERLEQFRRLPDHVRVLSKVGPHPMTAEERWVVAEFWKNNNVQSSEQWLIIQRAFQREYIHHFGPNTKFDAIINFEGYVRYWAALFAFGGETENRTMYLHSDMNQEWKKRFGHLEALFRTMPYYDSLISVGESANEENRGRLADSFNINPVKFRYCNNPLDDKRILDGAKVPLDEDLSEWMSKGSKVFVSVGRLSPEKDHEKLIRAFAGVQNEEPGARLVLVGDGVQRDRIAGLVKTLNLSQSVRMTGAVINPFNIMKAADCFVFSSNYEGQGLAILEAMVLGKPVISTDVTGARTVLAGGYGLLVENSDRGLEQGMIQFLRDNISRKAFDVDVYQEEAYKSFLRFALADLRAKNPA